MIKLIASYQLGPKLFVIIARQLVLVFLTKLNIGKFE